MTSRQPKLRLSFAGRLAVALAMGQVSSIALADIVAEHKGAQKVYRKGNVEIVDIAAPNGKGLSHNKYFKYNVDRAGAVLNNALQAGTSELAGDLNANGNFNGAAAKVILNEVIRHNPSLLLGKQEVFGMVADYVLANPGGVTCQGCGFINVPRASLVVGKPIVENGDLAGYEVKTDSKLVVGGTIDQAKILDLIAPAVELDGDVRAGDTVNVMMGRNHVTRERDGSVRAAKIDKAQRRRTLDGHLLGSIQAGRIRIHSTDSRATVVAEGLKVKADHVQLDAGKADLRGKLSREQVKQAKVENLGDGVFVRRNGFDKKESLQATEVAATSAAFNIENNLNVSGTKLAIDAFEVNAGNVNFGTQLSTNETSRSDRRYKGLWFHTDAQKNRQETVHGTQIQSNTVSISSASDITGAAVNLAARGVALKAKGKLTLSGRNQEKLTEKKVTFRNEIERNAKRARDAIKNGDALDLERAQDHIATSINTGKLVVNTGDDVAFSGVKIAADSAVVNAGGRIGLGAEQTSQQYIKEDVVKYWAGVGGSDSAGKKRDETIKVGSDVGVKQLIVLQAKNGVEISGSRIVSDKGAYVYTDKGHLTIDSVVNQLDEKNYKRVGSIFDITKDKTVTNQRQDSNQGSTLFSEANLQLLSKQDIDVVGSQVRTNGLLDIAATGKVNVAGTTDKAIDLKHHRTVGIEGAIDKLSLKDKEIAGHTSLVIKDNKTVDENQRHHASELTGGRGVRIEGEGVTVSGSKIQAVRGDVNIAASQLHTGSQSETQSAQNIDTATTLTLSAGANQKGATLGLALDLSHKNDWVGDSTVKNTQIIADNQVNLKGRQIVHQGTQLAGKVINEFADNIKHQAAHGGKTGTSTDAVVHAGVSVNVGYDKALAVNVGVNGKGGRKDSKDTRAQGTQFNAQVVNIKTHNSLRDEGTRYDGKDQVNLSARNLELAAASNEKGYVANRGGAGLGVNVSTKDYNSANVSLDVSASFQHEKDMAANAVKTQINSSNVSVNATENIHSQADIRAIDSINLVAGKDLVLGQANNTDTKRGGGFDAKVGVGAFVVPAAGAAVPSIDLALAVNGHNDSKKTGVAPQVSAKQLSMSSQGASVIQGTQIQADAVNVKGERIELTGLMDEHRKVGVDLAATVGLGADLSSVKLGASLDVEHGDALAYHANSVDAGSASLDGNKGVDLVATHLNAGNLNIKTDGNVNVQAGQNHDKHTNVGVSLALSGGVDKKVWHPAKGEASLHVDFGRNQSNTAGHSKAEVVTVVAGKDLAFHGESLTAGVATGHVAGDISTNGTQTITHEGKLSLQAAGAGKFTPYEPGKVLESLKNDWNKGTIAGVSASLKGDGKYVHKIENDTAKTGLHFGASTLNVDGRSIQAPDLPEKDLAAGFDFDVGTNLKERLEKGQPLVSGHGYFIDGRK